jgi:uncharacterized protein
MVVLEYRDIELDYCAICMGVWFDDGEVDLLLETVGIDTENVNLNLLPPENPVSEAKRRCPVCDKIMEKVAVPGGKVILDRCRYGDGLWFDAGEFTSACREGLKKDSDQDDPIFAITEFLGEALEEDDQENSEEK